MEQLLHYVWKHKLFPLSPLHTTDHRQVEVIDPGLHNRNAGPDFFNAKIKIDGMLWVGNIEIHDKASDWYLHGHEKDERYDNVVLHVCGIIDLEARNSKGEPPHADAAQHTRKRAPTLSGTALHRPVSTLLSDYPCPHPTLRTLLDERPANRATLTENRSYCRESEEMQRRLGKRILRDPGPQLRIRHQRGSLRAMGSLHPPALGRSSPRRPLPNRSHLLGTGWTARTVNHPRTLSERRTERRIFLQTQE